MTLRSPEGNTSPYNKELCNMMDQLEAEGEAVPEIKPFLPPIRGAINMRNRNRRYRVSSDDFVGLCGKMNILFQAADEFRELRSKPDEIRQLEEKLHRINSVGNV